MIRRALEQRFYEAVGRTGRGGLLLSLVRIKCELNQILRLLPVGSHNVDKSASENNSHAG